MGEFLTLSNERPGYFAYRVPAQFQTCGKSPFWFSGLKRLKWKSGPTGPENDELPVEWRQRVGR
jgi:hypothetical protein